jgi:uncharacterized Ntn-hydrolase superfamily protein
MTYSILARDPETGWCGMAVASRFFAVGHICLWSEGHVGLVSTQALINPTNGRRALEGLREGLAPATVVERIVRADPVSDQRQLHLMAWDGRTAAVTGARCVEWCGSRSEANLSVAGNMLAGPAVVADTFASFRARTGPDLPARLLAAMRAGEAAGGDHRGRQSAALAIQGPEPFQRLSLRADDHDDPLAELERLYAVACERYLAFARSYPTPAQPDGLGDRAAIDRMIEADAGRPFDPARTTAET